MTNYEKDLFIYICNLSFIILFEQNRMVLIVLSMLTFCSLKVFAQLTYWK